MNEVKTIPGLTDDEILLEPEAFQSAALCGPTKMYELIAQGQIEARKVGRKTGITLASTKRYLQSRPKIPARAA